MSDLLLFHVNYFLHVNYLRLRQGVAIFAKQTLPCPFFGVICLRVAL